jgi:CDP-diacylglycerol--serine O-phosphatidyltransferase
MNPRLNIRERLIDPNSPDRRPRRAAYALPTFFTAGNLFLGFLAILKAVEGALYAASGHLGFNPHFELAAEVIGMSIFFDGLDGRIARMTNTTSDFGRELDSLADMISFGIAPAVLGFVWGFYFLDPATPEPMRGYIMQAGYFLIFCFVLCGAARLARFNVTTNPKPRNPGRPDRKYFVGLPIPAAAGLVAAVVYFFQSRPLVQWPWVCAWLALLALLSYLMVCTWRYRSFKDLNLMRPRSPITVVALGMIIYSAWFFSKTFLLVLYGGILVIQDHLGVGTLFTFQAYMLIFQPPFRQLGMVIMNGQRASASARRIYEILDQPQEVKSAPDAADLIECRGDVHFDHVGFAYSDGTQVLNDFDLHISPGETVALVGRTGSGKTTAGRLLNRSYDVSEGRLLVDGRDVREYTLESLRAQVGFVFDEPFLFSVSIRDNIAYGKPTATMEEVVEAARAADADEFIVRLPDGYATVIGERGYTLSGGQRQRLAIARTLLVNPPVLVLDDATSAIDVQVEQRIHAALLRLMVGRTTLLIAHRLATISLADRVVLVDNGHVIASGRHLELLENNPRYAEVLARVVEEAGQGPEGEPRR